MAEPLSALGAGGQPDAATAQYLALLEKTKVNPYPPGSEQWQFFEDSKANAPSKEGWWHHPIDAAVNVGKGLKGTYDWFLNEARKPEGEAQADVRGLVGSAANIIPKAFQASEERRQGGAYDPGPILNAAMLGTSGGLLGGTGGEAGMVLTAGRRGKPPLPPAALEANPRAVIGGNSPPPEFQFPQYATEYPPVGPPTWTFDKVKDKYFDSKTLTPEAEVFQEARDKIKTDMATKGYTPFFDPAQRTDVDPTHYPPNVDTTTIVPKKQSTTDEYMQGAPAVVDPVTGKVKKQPKSALDSDEVRGRLQEAYKRGSEMPNTRNWYFMGQLENEFIKELGPVEGRKQFQEKFTVPMSATTSGNDPTANLLSAQYGNYLRTNNLPLPENSHQYPVLIGGQYAKTNMDTFQRVMDQGGFPSLREDNPKRHNFSQNFTGNPDVATMDEQMTGGMTPGKQLPPTGTYGLYESILKQEAAKAGVSPREFQEVGWAGFKNMKDPRYTSGKPMIEHVNEAIERTHRLTGMPRDEIMKQAFIYGKIPLYALGATLGAGAIAGQSRQPYQ